MLFGLLPSFLFSLILLCTFLFLPIPGHASLVFLPCPFACEILLQAKTHDCPLMDYLLNIERNEAAECEGYIDATVQQLDLPDALLVVEIVC